MKRKLYERHDKENKNDNSYVITNYMKEDLEGPEC